MKRSLLLVAVTLLALAVPTVASACQWICEGAFGPCVYEQNTWSICHDVGPCWMEYCRTSEAASAELLSTKWKIASVEIERRGPVDKREAEVQVASNPDPVPVKTESLK